MGTLGLYFFIAWHPYVHKWDTKECKWPGDVYIDDETLYLLYCSCRSVVWRISVQHLPICEERSRFLYFIYYSPEDCCCFIDWEKIFTYLGHFSRQSLGPKLNSTSFVRLKSYGSALSSFWTATGSFRFLTRKENETITELACTSSSQAYWLLPLPEDTYVGLYLLLYLYAPFRYHNSWYTSNNSNWIHPASFWRLYQFKIDHFMQLVKLQMY